MLEVGTPVIGRGKDLVPISTDRYIEGSPQGGMESVCRVVIDHAWLNVSNVVADQTVL